MPKSLPTDQVIVTLDEKQKDRLWNWLLHEGNLFNGRQQLFAVAEAMLLGAFATMQAGQKPDHMSLRAMCVVGGFSCLMWLYANLNQIHRYIKPIRNALEPHMPEWRAVRQVGVNRLRNTTVLGVLLPLTIASLWLILVLRIDPANA
jgi:hypothetical protein